MKTISFFETFLLQTAWVALFTLAFLKIVLGIDNIVFLSIMSSKLPPEQQQKARAVCDCIFTVGGICEYTVAEEE